MSSAAFEKAVALQRAAIDAEKSGDPPPPAPETSGGAALTDLRPADKEKVGNLLRELAREQSSRQEYQRRLQSLRSQNSEIVQETQELKTKFRNSLNLLKTYQHTLAKPTPTSLARLQLLNKQLLRARCASSQIRAQDP